jgi:hypothetical protein
MTAWAVGCSSSGTDASSPPDVSAPMDSSAPDAGPDAADAQVDAERDASSDANDAARAVDGSDAGLFAVNCPSGTTYYEGFNFDPVRGRTWTLLAGSYSWSPGSVTINSGSPNSQLWIGPRPNWTNYTISTMITPGPSSYGINAGINIRMEDSPSFPAPSDSGQMYFAGINPTGVILGAESSGTWTQLLDYSTGSIAEGTSYTMVVGVNGHTITVSLDGTTYIHYTDPTFAFGSFGLRTMNSSATFGPITVTCN